MGFKFSFLPVCLWLLLKTLNDGPNLDIKVAFFYVALLTISSMTKATSTQHYDYLTELWGLRLKVALIGLVYKKVSFYGKPSLGFLSLFFSTLLCLQFVINLEI